MTDTDPVRGREILFHIRCKGDPGGRFQPKVLCHYEQQEAKEEQAHRSHAVVAQSVSDILDIS